MRSQPADVHRSQRPCAPCKQSGHMTASAPDHIHPLFVASWGPSTHGSSPGQKAPTAWAGGSRVVADRILNPLGESRILRSLGGAADTAACGTTARYAGRRGGDPNGLGHGPPGAVSDLVLRLRSRSAPAPPPLFARNAAGCRADGSYRAAGPRRAPRQSAASSADERRLTPCCRATYCTVRRLADGDTRAHGCA